MYLELHKDKLHFANFEACVQFTQSVANIIIAVLVSNFENQWSTF